MDASPHLATLPASRPSLELRMEQTPQPRLQKFDAAFIERRMQEHREMMLESEQCLTYDIICEVLMATEVRSGRNH